MTNSKKKTVYDDCLGDTVSEGDTSDDECIESSSKSTTTGNRKEDLEIPQGCAGDDSHRNRTRIRRNIIYTSLVILALTVISATIFGGVYIAKNKSLSSPSQHDIDFSVPEGDVDAPLSTVEQPQEMQSQDDSSLKQKVPETASESIAIPNNSDLLGLMEEFVDYNVENDKNDVEGNVTNSEDEDEDAQPTQWPDLMGMTGEEAKTQLELLYGEETYKITVMNYNSPTTRDYRTDRIRIFTDDEGIVIQVPRIG